MAFLSLSVNFATMADFDDEDQEFFVANLANDSVVTHTIAPVALQFAGQRLPEESWIRLNGDALIEVARDLSLRLRAELGKLFLRPLVEADLPIHTYESTPQG